MEFRIEKSLEILEKTPSAIRAMLQNLSDDWILNNEGPETWSPFDIVGHLIFGEKTDWMVRLKIILNYGPERTFTPFDRFAQFHESKGKTLGMLLDEFETLRRLNLQEFKALRLRESDFGRTGTHPAFGEVTLKNLIAAWTVHDLGHIAQISRVMAKQWTSDVGPWQEYLPVLHR